MADFLTANELIAELRDQAEVIGPGTEYHLLNEAADMIETLDERVAIMGEPQGARLMSQDDLDMLLTGDACWLEMRECSWPANANMTGWVLFRSMVQVGVSGDETDWLWFFGTLSKPNTLPLPEKTYGLEWRCWDKEPTDEQRAVKWQ